MGIDLHNLALLAHASDLGVRYERTLGVGRQGVFVDPPDLERVRALRGWPTLDPAPRWFEPLLRGWLGAHAVDSIDASPYEQASLIHDLNQPLPAAFPGEGTYDAVLDFGCLEHVFDFPTAWRNCVRACRVGGHLLHSLPANNLCGHGFWQFSPELFWSLYREANGFRVRGLWLATKADARHWRQVAEPRSLGRRVLLHNASETYLLVIAEKVADVATFATPQQSDYAAGEWLANAGRPVADASATASAAGRSTAAATASADRARATATASESATAPASATATARGPSSSAAALRTLGLLDAARVVRDLLRVARSSATWPAPDYERIDVDALLRRGAQR